MNGFSAFGSLEDDPALQASVSAVSLSIGNRVEKLTGGPGSRENLQDWADQIEHSTAGLVLNLQSKAQTAYAAARVACLVDRLKVLAGVEACSGRAKEAAKRVHFQSPKNALWTIVLELLRKSTRYGLVSKRRCIRQSGPTIR